MKLHSNSHDTPQIDLFLEKNEKTVKQKFKNKDWRSTTDWLIWSYFCHVNYVTFKVSFLTEPFTNKISPQQWHVENLSACNDLAPCSTSSPGVIRFSFFPLGQTFWQNLIPAEMINLNISLQPINTQSMWVDIAQTSSNWDLISPETQPKTQ